MKGWRRTPYSRDKGAGGDEEKVGWEEKPRKLGRGGASASEG